MRSASVRSVSVCGKVEQIRELVMNALNLVMEPIADSDELYVELHFSYDVNATRSRLIRRNGGQAVVEDDPVKGEKLHKLLVKIAKHIGIRDTHLQKHLSGAFGFSESYVSRLFSGKKKLRTTPYKKILRAINSKDVPEDLLEELETFVVK